MKTVFDPKVREELISRIQRLNSESVALWGKMSVFQMLKHCTSWEEMILRNKRYKRVLPGLLFGKIALRMVLKDEKPLGRNSPTIPDLKITGGGEVEPEKEKWIALIREYPLYTHPYFVHPFFGTMSNEQVGRFSYKHTDHHLRQFGC